MQFVRTEIPSCHRQTLVPRTSAISSSGALFIRKRLANVCRKSCQRKFLIPTSSTASSNQCLPFSSGSPVLATETHALFRRPVMHNPEGGHRSII